jgi:putative DNA primase/helicase
VSGFFGRDYDDDGQLMYDPADPLDLLREAAETTDPGERPAAVVRAVQRIVAGGMDAAAEQSARAYVQREKLLPVSEFARVVKLARAQRAPKPAAGVSRAAARPANTDERHRSHLRMAERMAREYAGLLRYAHGLGWLAWDGTRWAPDKDGKPFRAAINVVKKAIAEADGDASLADDVRSVETSMGLRGIVTIDQYLKPLAISVETLDTDPYLFNCANGTLDLRTMELRKHNPADLITKVTGCGYYPDAAGPAFEKFLSEILPQEDVREYVRRLAGYALLGKVTEHVLGIFTGTGLNGKTTLIELLLKAFGDYGIMADPELLPEHPYGQHPTGQADLLGVRLAVTQETDQGRKLAVATVKRLTGGDKIRARRMRQDFFEFDPSHTVIMVTNHKPRIPGDDPATWRRIRVTPFDRVIENPDAGLPDRLALELPAVLAWLVEGYRDYAASGLAEPETVTRRTQEYRVSSDAVGRFLAERTVPGQFRWVRTRELYAAWQKWAADVGEEPGRESDFRDSIENRGFERKHTKAGNVYRGLGLMDGSDEADVSAARDGK